MNKLVAQHPFNAGQVVEIARVSELIEIDNCVGFLRQPLQDEIRANEPGSASDQNRVFHGKALGGRASANTS